VIIEDNSFIPEGSRLCKNGIYGGVPALFKTHVSNGYLHAHLIQLIRIIEVFQKEVSANKN
jgi:hypothetical protein